ATAGWRLHDDTARKIRTARSATPSAPTPVLADIDSRSPSEGLKDACEPYHRLHGPSIDSHGSWRLNGSMARRPRRSVRDQRLRSGASGERDVRVGVRERHEGRLELRRRQEHAAREHLVEVARVALRVGALGRSVVRYWVPAKEARQHRADTVHRQRHARLIGAGFQSTLELTAERLETTVGVGLPELGDRRETRR